MRPTVAISVGDLNGIGIAIALEAHSTIRRTCRPLYCINRIMLDRAAALLGTGIPDDFKTVDVPGDFPIKPGTVDAASGRYAYDSFMKGIGLCEKGEAAAVVTLPIHKEAWMEAGLPFKGHTDLLRRHFNAEAIMMLGCNKLYVALFTEHMPLRNVSDAIEEKALTRFLLDFRKETQAEKIAVLGLNPHAGDNGVLGDEERIIERAIANANGTLASEKGMGKEESDADVFHGPVVPDIAFTPAFRKNFRHMVAMYHDQGLAPLKALYFDESINVSLNLPIVRTSVDHGTAFDIAYRGVPRCDSYLNAVAAALELSKARAGNRE
jgi:4-hydroxythreonine-4-phosphate dehydrogenase